MKFTKAYREALQELGHALIAHDAAQKALLRAKSMEGVAEARLRRAEREYLTVSPV